MTKNYDVLYFIVPGEPKGKQRPHFTSRGGKRAYTPAQTVAYEKEIGYLAKQAIAKRGKWELDGAFEITISACFEIPKSWPKWQQEAATEGEYPHITRPDCDNIEKVVCDALNKIVWADDSKLHHTEVYKFYTIEGPCLQIAIWREEIITFPVWQKLKKKLKGGKHEALNN
jgi:Holliday junction resolvase RusA-like endonuclease